MSENPNEKRVRLDLNSEIFQENLLALDKGESTRVLNTLRKLRQMTWAQVYRDSGLKWKKIESVEAAEGHRRDLLASNQSGEPSHCVSRR